jgi:predicted extracellular nuclease
VHVLARGRAGLRTSPGIPGSHKTVTALQAIEVDIVGLIELESDGCDPTATTAELVNAPNSLEPRPTYTFVNPGMAKIGTDEIAVGFIDKHARSGGRSMFLRVPSVGMWHLNADGAISLDYNLQVKSVDRSTAGEPLRARAPPLVRSRSGRRWPIGSFA